MKGLSPQGVEGGLRLGAQAVDAGLEARRVDGIAHHGMANVGEMHPDLVGAAGFEMGANEARQRGALLVLEGFQHLVMRDRVAACFAVDDGHARAIVGMTADASVDRAHGTGEMAQTRAK